MSLENKKLEFLKELAGFVFDAEQTLKSIEEKEQAKSEDRKELFKKFSIWMLTIRGTSDQMGLSHVSELAGLGEEIAVKGELSDKAHLHRKCISSLWDALTTMKYLIEHPDVSTTEEQAHLKNRLEITLKSMGGQRDHVSASEIDALLSQMHNQMQGQSRGDESE